MLQKYILYQKLRVALRKSMQSLKSDIYSTNKKQKQQQQKQEKEEKRQMINIKNERSGEVITNPMDIKRIQFINIMKSSLPTHWITN